MILPGYDLFRNSAEYSAISCKLHFSFSKFGMGTGTYLPTKMQCDKLCTHAYPKYRIFVIVNKIPYFSKLVQLSDYTWSTAERNLSLALQMLNDNGAKLGIPKDIKETAALIYRRAVEKNLIRGRSIESIVCASIYAACRMVNLPRTLDEISKASEVNKKKIGKAYRHLAKELSLNLRPTTPYSYVAQFCSKLDLDKQAIIVSEDIVRRSTELGISSGKGPTGVAAASIYIASVMVGKPRTQKEIARVSGVTEVTIRNRYKEISKSLGIPGME